MKKFFIGLVMLLVVGTSSASMVDSCSMPCPVCEKEFEAYYAVSGYQDGQRLDLKPLGAITAPWVIPHCYECGFVVYSDNISPAELAKCKAVVESDAYRKCHARSTYYMLAKLYEGLGREVDELAYTYLQASWEEEGDPGYLREDLTLSLQYFENWLQQSAATDGGYQTAQLTKGELLRRLGRFDEAEAHFAMLKKMADFKKEHNKQVVKYQLKLCRKKNSDPQVAPEAKKGFFARCRSFFSGLRSKPETTQIELCDAVDIPDGAITHVMYPGETLADVCLQFRVDKKALMQKNGLRDDSSVTAGLRLWIPTPE